MALPSLSKPLLGACFLSVIVNIEGELAVKNNRCNKQPTFLTLFESFG
jgi:hypothetical protein